MRLKAQRKAALEAARKVLAMPPDSRDVGLGECTEAAAIARAEHNRAAAYANRFGERWDRWSWLEWGEGWGGLGWQFVSLEKVDRSKGYEQSR